MNVSGNSLHAFERQRHIAEVQRQLVVVCDDLDSKPGSVKLKAEGSAR